MKKILALGGSTSATSINRQLASFASQLVPNAETTLIDLNDYEAPIYSIDKEREGFPESMLKLVQYKYMKQQRWVSGIRISFI